MALEERDGHTAYREQTVEIALGPKGAFENGNIGVMSRRVPADRVVSALPPRRGRPKPPKVSRPPRVAELLRKAMEWRRLLKAGEVPDQAQIARRDGLTRARVTQVMGLLRLAPEIQKHILSMPNAIGQPAVTERLLRPLVQIEDSRQQIQKFEKLLSQVQS